MDLATISINIEMIIFIALSWVPSLFFKLLFHFFPSISPMKKIQNKFSDGERILHQFGKPFFMYILQPLTFMGIYAVFIYRKVGLMDIGGLIILCFASLVFFSYRLVFTNLGVYQYGGSSKLFTIRHIKYKDIGKVVLNESILGIASTGIISDIKEETKITIPGCKGQILEILKKAEAEDYPW